MKSTRRTGVFESNSSSMHSISIMKGENYCTKEEIKDEFYLHDDGSWNIWDFEMEFGRSPFKCLSSFKNKWMYCLAALHDHRKELENIAFKYVDGLKKIEYPIVNSFWYRSEVELEQYLYEYEETFGLQENSLNYWERDGYFSYQYPYIGYAEDYGMMKKFIEQVPLEEFLTNKKYIIIVDGDEHCVYDDLKKAGLINTDKIEREYNETDY